jgi:Rrf2 family nitric oxide-sensitive transcriptional repressor
MQLTRFTDYSLRVLMYLAVRPERLGQIEEISKSYGISRGHVMKVVRGLSRHGFIDSVRGRGGGIRLARPTSEIGLGEVVRATEENLGLVECLSIDGGSCVVQPACGLQTALGMALEAFFVVLDDFTIEDLVKRRGALTRLLEIA